MLIKFNDLLLVDRLHLRLDIINEVLFFECDYLVDILMVFCTFDL